MKIEIVEGGAEARVVDRLGLRMRTFVRVGPGCWVGDDGGWASRELAIRISHVAERSQVLVDVARQTERRLLGEVSRA